MNRDEEALAEMRPSQQNGESVGSRPGSGAASPAKADSHEGTPTAKRKSKVESRVRVFVRVRPAVRKNELDANEGDKGSTSAIHCQGPKLWLLEEGLSGDKGGKGGQDAKTRQFVFDGSLSPESTQEDVYRYASASPLPSLSLTPPQLTPPCALSLRLSPSTAWRSRRRMWCPPCSKASTGA